MKMGDSAVILRRNKPGTKAKVRKMNGWIVNNSTNCKNPVQKSEIQRFKFSSVIKISLFFLFVQEFGFWPDEPVEEMDSTLAVQQFIQQLIKKDPANVEQILAMPDGQDEGVWKYEHLR